MIPLNNFDISLIAILFQSPEIHSLNHFITTTFNWTNKLWQWSRFYCICIQMLFIWHFSTISVTKIFTHITDCRKCNKITVRRDKICLSSSVEILGRDKQWKLSNISTWMVDRDSLPLFHLYESGINKHILGFIIIQHRLNWN